MINIEAASPLGDDMAIALLETELNLTDKLPAVLTDLDLTLFDQFVFDPQTNNHTPVISPELVRAARPNQITAATGRRATNPAIGLLWQSGLIRPQEPIIAENGGVLVSQDQDGTYVFRDLIAADNKAALHEVKQAVQEQVTSIPDGLHLICKMGRTMLVTALQDAAGRKLPEHQQLLAMQLRETLPPGSLTVVDTRASVTIQPESVSKGRAFGILLEEAGVTRGDLFVVGMGDGENDAGLFEAADFSIGFSPAVCHLVAVEVTGAALAPMILQTIGRRRMQLLAGSRR